MTWHKEIWTYLIVTLVAVLIWAWAASETRERKSLPSAKLHFVVAPDVGNWTIDKPTVSPILSVEGTKLAVQRLTQELQKPLLIEIPVNSPVLLLNLVEAIQKQTSVMSTGATIVAADPETIELRLDQMDQVSARVKPILAGVTPEGEVLVQPREVMVSLPRTVKQRLSQELTVEAFVDRGELDQLAPGVPQTLDDVPLRISDPLVAGQDLQITPGTVTVSFTIRSRIRETSVDSVRVQIGGPIEDRDAFLVEVDPKVLRNITVLADADMSKEIEAGDVPVIAMIHLSSREKEAMIAQKPVSLFVALIPDLGGGTRYQQLNVKPGTVMPMVNLKITPRTSPP